MPTYRHGYRSLCVGLDGTVGSLITSAHGEAVIRQMLNEMRRSPGMLCCSIVEKPLGNNARDAGRAYDPFHMSQAMEDTAEPGRLG